MKKIISVVIVIFAVTFGSFAQKGGDKTPEKRAQKASSFLQKKLTLTEEQKGKVYQAVLERATKLEELRAQNLEKTAMLQQSKPIRDNFNSQMKEALTPEQFAKWEQLKSEKKSNMAEKRGKGREGKFKKGQEDKTAEKGDSLGDID